MPFAAALLIICLYGCRQSTHDIQKPERNLVQRDTVQGNITVAGNEPFTKLILTTYSGLSVEISADSSLSRTLWKLQNTNVVLIGILRKRLDRNILEVRELKAEP